MFSSYIKNPDKINEWLNKPIKNIFNEALIDAKKYIHPIIYLKYYGDDYNMIEKHILNQNKPQYDNHILKLNNDLDLLNKSCDKLKDDNINLKNELELLKKSNNELQDKLNNESIAELKYKLDVLQRMYNQLIN